LRKHAWLKEDCAYFTLLLLSAGSQDHLGSMLSLAGVDESWTTETRRLMTFVAVEDMGSEVS
jgi:hypothetical protein